MAKEFDPFLYPKGKIPKYLPVYNAVLFIDVVGFSKRTTNDDMKDMIRRILAAIEDILDGEYYWGESKGRNHLILIPTGDGLGIGFHPDFDQEKVLQIAIGFFKLLTGRTSIRIRVGIAKGPNVRFLDKNDLPNLFGYGINLARRVVDSARPNEILVHEDFAKDLLRVKRLPNLVEVKKAKRAKHGFRVRVYTLLPA